MSDRFCWNSEVRERFFDELLQQNWANGRQNRGVYLLFHAIQEAFAPVGNLEGRETAFVAYEMIRYLAACSWAALGYNADQEIPLHDAQHDFILKKTLKYFLLTLEESIREGNFWNREGEPYYGGFKIPAWFVYGVQETMKEEARQMEESKRKFGWPDT